MKFTLELARRATRLRAIAAVSGLLALSVGACSDADKFAPESTMAANFDSIPVDSLAVADSLGIADSLALADTLVLDSLTLDSLAAADSVTPSVLFAEASLFARAGIPFGPEGLWADYTSLRSTAIPFTGSTNFTDARGIVKQINAARAKRQRLTLNMTGGGHHRYKTNGKFDLRKWKAVMNTYNTRAIKTAVRQGVADGTIIMNTVMDEPNVKSWGGVMTKPLLDQMARYVKTMFPTLPAGVALRHDWRPYEKFRVMDAFIAQYSWYRGSVTKFRSEALAAAKTQRMSVAFAMNILDGGIHNFKRKDCPLSITGGRGTYSPACRMTARQVREWGRALGPAGCAMFLWRYDRTFMSKTVNVQALRDVASTLAKTPGRSCRRS